MRQANCFGAVCSFAYHRNVRFILQNAAETSSHKTMIIHEQNCDLIPHGSPDFLWEPAIEPTCRPLAVVRIRAFHPATLRARASLPCQFRAFLPAPRSRCRDPRFRAEDWWAEISAAPKPPQPRNGG